MLLQRLAALGIVKHLRLPRLDWVNAQSRQDIVKGMLV